MRPSLIAALLLLVPPASAGEAWPPLPPGTAAQMIVSGADFGFLSPLGCYHGEGGALLRLDLERRLAARGEPPRTWLSTGNVLPAFEGGGNAGPELMYPHLAEVGYRAVGVGLADLATVTPDEIARHAAGLPFPLVSTNLVVWETGRPFFAGSALVEIGGHDWLVLAAMRHDATRLWHLPSGATVATVPPGPAVAEAIERERGRFDRVLLLSTLSQGALRDLLAEAGPVDLVVGTVGGTPPSSPETIAGTTVLWLGDAGRWLGRIALDGEARPIGLDVIIAGRDLGDLLTASGARGADAPAR